MIFSENRPPPTDQVRGQAFPDHALANCTQETGEIVGDVIDVR
jgi:hypothetical protein